MAGNAMLLLAAGAFAATTAGVIVAGDTLFGDDAEPQAYELAQADPRGCPVEGDAELARIQSGMPTFTRISLMVDALSSPVKALDLVDAVNTPRLPEAMITCDTAPRTMAGWMIGLARLDDVGPALRKTMHPKTVLRWMMAPANPEVWKRAAAQLNPGRYLGWVETPVAMVANRTAAVARAIEWFSLSRNAETLTLALNGTQTDR
jgi:hypothetical protein